MGARTRGARILRGKRLEMAAATSNSANPPIKTKDLLVKSEAKRARTKRALAGSEQPCSQHL
jgi:hypothetical protein